MNGLSRCPCNLVCVLSDRRRFRSWLFSGAGVLTKPTQTCRSTSGCSCTAVPVAARSLLLLLLLLLLDAKNLFGPNFNPSPCPLSAGIVPGAGSVAGVRFRAG